MVFARSPVSARAAALHRFGDQPCNVGIRPADRVSGEVGVARGCLGLGMTKQLAAHRQAETAGGSVRGKGVAQVVDSDIIEACAFSNPPPGPLEICEMCAGLVPDNDIGVAGEAGDGFEQLCSLRAEIDGPLARLGIVEPDFFAFEIDAAPFEFLDFAKPAACDDQQPEGHRFKSCSRTQTNP